MDTKVSIAVIGGDARYLEMIRHLTLNPEIELSIIGFDQLNQGFTGAKQVEIEELKLSSLDAIILPVPGTDQQGFIETVFSDKKIQLTQSWFSKLKKGCLVFTGITTPYLNNMAEQSDVKLIPLFARDDVAIYNSIPTVEGTIMMAIQHTDFTIHSSDVIVLGLGRVGITLANKFAGLGARVSVGSKNKEDLARITEMGLTPFHLNDLTSYSPNCDFLLNTIPALVVTKEVIKPMKSHSLIIDLASKPGGTDFKFAEQRGIKAMPAPGLPGIVAPKTAGAILGRVVTQVLTEYMEERSQ
ncbi:dipicolinic acid synthetase subunit A [Sediminibacillus albus]|uniref:Dipicolinate synthase subunit A n=1 Tax=Sediminibacillus albus TaxID=407036 RepID=A0A1G8VZZ8_9BACI|nr:dipicolinic acid synthetase subunit A [Sediminibacillus albus]SDJ71427.1 dipicolinate synthase subunit A [Sediminibacillus albus]